MKVGFIIVSYNSEAQKLIHILKATSEFYVVVIDNGGTSDINLKSKAQLLTNDSNEGFSVGANEGIKKLLEERIDWFVILNQDLHISSDAVNLLVKNLQMWPPSIVGPTAGSFDKNRWTTILPSKGSIDYVSGSCIAIHRDVIQKIGRFYEPYFMYYEDVDLCVRAKKAGFSIKKIEVPGIIHKGEPILKKGSFYHEYYLARNHLLFVQRNAPISVKLHEIARMPLTLAGHYKNGNVGALTGIKDFALRRFGPYRRGV